MTTATAALGTLTDRQRKIVNVFRDAFLARVDAPTLGGIMRFLRIKSPNGAKCHYRYLIKKGWIETQGNEFRDQTTRSSGASRLSERYRLTEAALAELGISWPPEYRP